MENSMLNNLLFDPAYLIIGLAALTLVLMILTLVCFSQYRKLYRRYDMFMRQGRRDPGGHYSGSDG